MFERWFLLDAGAYELRLHDCSKHTDAKTRTIVAVKNNQPLFYGQEAISCIYQDPLMQIRYPIWEDSVDSMIHSLIENCMNVLQADQSLLKPCIWMAVPNWYDEAYRTKWQHILLDSGIKKVKFITNMDLLQTKEACFLIHAGHSCTEMGIYVNGTCRSYKKIFFAGSRMDEQIKRIVATKTNCLISNEDAMALKKAASDAFWKNQNVRLSCTALDRYQHMQRISISAWDLWPGMEMIEQQIVLWAKQCFKEQPLQMKEALLKNGFLLSGGLAHCFGLRQLLEQAFGCTILHTNTPEYDIINTMKELKG